MKIIRTVMVLVLITTMSLFLSPQEAHAITKTWIGGDGSWSDGTMWSPEGVPDISDEVIIDSNPGVNSSVSLIIGYDTSVWSLTIDSGDTLVIIALFECSGAINNNGTIDNYSGGTINSNGAINNNGTINNNNLGFINSNGGIENYGTINNDGLIANNPNNHINNYGTINNYDTIDNDGTIDNYGTINNDTGGTIHNFGTIYNHIGAIFNNEGSFSGNPIIDLSNTPPIANDDSYSGMVSTTLNIGAPGVLENDSDPDGDTLVVDSHTQPSDGSVAVNPDGSFTYTPNIGFTGADIFNYTVSDGNGGTDTALVTITVNPGAAKKLDLDVFQAPWKGFAIYHIGASMDGVPVPVTLYSAKGLYFVEDEGLFYDDVTGFSRAVFDGHLVLNVEDGNKYSFFQFIVEHNDNGTPRYGTCFVINNNYKRWPK